MMMKRGMLSLTLAIVFVAGCKVPGSTSTAFPWQTSPQAPAAQVAKGQAPQSESQEAGFSLQSLFQLAGFQQTALPAADPAPKAVADLGSVISKVAQKSMELNINDPAEVTRQKALAILEALNGWDSSLAATTSTGLVNGETAQTLSTWVAQLRTETQKLVKFAPDAQTIATVQELAGGLYSTFGKFSSLLEQGSALLGSNRGGRG